jgi:mRNA interferase YafQ
MHELVLTPRFQRSFNKLVRKNSALQSLIEQSLQRMATNLNDPRLKTHHLSGQLSGLFSCSVGYDCRIVFAKHKQKNAEVLLPI